MDWYKVRVRIRAYELWEAEGRSHGKDWAHWFRAESELKTAWSSATIQQNDFWSGVDRKLDTADYFLGQMSRSLDRPRDHHSAALEAMGAVLDTQWQRSFYANLDAFLVMSGISAYETDWLS
jgi:hypothetical protein